MKRNSIRLTETQLRQIIKESVQRVLKETQELNKAEYNPDRGYAVFSYYDPRNGNGSAYYDGKKFSGMEERLTPEQKQELVQAYNDGVKAQQAQKDARAAADRQQGIEDREYLRSLPTKYSSTYRSAQRDTRNGEYWSTPNGPSYGYR